MPKPFAAFDIDGTLFKSSLTEKMILGGIEHGLFDPEAFGEVMQDRRSWQRDNGEEIYQTYLKKLVRGFVAQISGVRVDDFMDVADQVLAEQEVRMNIFPRDLIGALGDRYELVAISGSPRILVEPFVQKSGIERVFGSEFEVKRGEFTGKATNVGDKAEILKTLIADGIVSRRRSIAVGDTASDFTMLRFAERPVMFNPSKTLDGYGKNLGMPRVIEVKDNPIALEYDPRANHYLVTAVEGLITHLSRREF